MRLATSRYQNGEMINASGLAPTRTSRGYPRFRLKYKIAGSVPGLYPTREELSIQDNDEFERDYCSRLDDLGVDVIRGRLETVARDAAKPGCVLLCYEDVHAGEACHRRTFAKWWQSKTGQAVPELR
jgi:hypothetical protein